jgi:hypothetical protein
LRIPASGADYNRTLEVGKSANVIHDSIGQTEIDRNIK